MGNSASQKPAERDYHPESLQKYNFQSRCVPYRTEYLEISEEELRKIKSIKSTPVQLFQCKQQDGVIKVIIDTDIGTDVDDALALLYALQLPNLQILGVTTNYGPTELRAQIAQKIVDNHQIFNHLNKQDKLENIPVVAGASLQLGTHRSIFLAGHEGLPFLSPQQQFEQTDPLKWKRQCQTDAADFIIQQILRFPNEVKIISIGIPTNIALALQRNPGIVIQIDEIVLMGAGSFLHQDAQFVGFGTYSLNQKNWEQNQEQTDGPFGVPEKENIEKWVCEGNRIHTLPNHNLSGDTMASKFIFDQPGLKIKVIPHDITGQYWLEGQSIEFLRNQAKIFAPDVQNPFVTVGHLVEQWMTLRGQNGQCPHDPLTVHEAAFGDSGILYARGQLVVHEWAAYSTFTPTENGTHIIGMKVENKEKFMNQLENLMMGELE